MRNANQSAVTTSVQLVELVYELLDAHGDTVVLADGLDDPTWGAHIDYLRDLQRISRAALARVQL